MPWEGSRTAKGPWSSRGSKRWRRYYSIARVAPSGYTPKMILSVLAGALALAMILLVLLRGRSDAASRSSAPSGASGAIKQALGAEGQGKAGPRPGACALCGSKLAVGESMRSDILPGGGDRLMRVYGCPHCLGSESERVSRYCPVCDSALGPTDHAIALYVERPGRKHVHILGCTICRKNQGR